MINTIKSSLLVGIPALCLIIGSIVLADMIHAGLPGWWVDGRNTIESIHITRMDIAASDTNVMYSITNRADVIAFADNFSTFGAGGCLAYCSKLRNPLFQIVVIHDQKRTTIYLTVERGGTGNAGQPAALVILWHQLPNGRFEEYGSKIYAPLKKTEDPDIVIMIKNLFKKGG